MTRLPRTKPEIPTPALLVDLDRLERNLHRLAEHCRANGVSFRPHAKTHKCPNVARLQIAAGAVGISVATVFEAEAMVQAGIRGVLLTSPLAEPHKVDRMVDLVRGGSEVLIAVGHAMEVDMLAAASSDLGPSALNVLIDLDVGDRRTGVQPGDEAVTLAQQIATKKSLRLRGVQAYAGHASHVVGFAERAMASQAALALAVDAKQLLKQKGFEADILSCGSTGTWNIDSRFAGVTELQCGSYVFMDIDYRRIGGSDNAPLFVDFEHSLTVLSTVISAGHADRVTVDAGIKAFSTETPFRAEAVDQPHLVYTRTGDEFGIITLGGPGALPKLGDRLEFLPPHCDPTVHLYDQLYAMRGEQVEAIWPIRARREN
jgi:D-serine deaminase-like pyridoxal phosphate-dependent protein